MTDTLMTDKDGWIKHDGGLCPVDADAIVDIIICSGNGFQSGMARDFFWKILPELNGSITHYRIHKPEPDYKALLEQAVEALGAQENLCNVGLIFAEEGQIEAVNQMRRVALDAYEKEVK